MLDEQQRVALMSDEQRVEFCKNMNAEDYREIPEYWNEHLKEKIAEIRAQQVKAGASGTSFALIADFHYTVNCLHSPAILKKVLDECSIPYYILAGDYVSGMGVVTPENLINELIAVRSLFSTTEEKGLWVQGNHDPAYSTFPGQGYCESLKENQIYEYMYRHQTQYANRVFGPEGRYFYADDTPHKVRYIGLDFHDTPNDDLKEDGKPVYPKMNCCGICQEQLTWFANVALKVPSADWTVVLATHESLEPDAHECFYNRSQVLGLIDAFRKHTAYEGTATYEDRPLYNTTISADFTGAGGDFAVWVGGHTHRNIEQRPNGILCISTASDSFNDIGNTDEQVIDVMTINKEEHKIYITRIGRGLGRELSYEVF